LVYSGGKDKNIIYILVNKYNDVFTHR
jgi:hypothetical protein